MHAMRTLHRLKARIGVLVPPPDSIDSEEWGGTKELLGISETIPLDASSKTLASDMEILVNGALHKESDLGLVQTCLF